MATALKSYGVGQRLVLSRRWGNPYRAGRHGATCLVAMEQLAGLDDLEVDRGPGAVIDLGARRVTTPVVDRAASGEPN